MADRWKIGRRRSLRCWRAERRLRCGSSASRRRANPRRAVAAGVSPARKYRRDACGHVGAPFEIERIGADRAAPQRTRSPRRSSRQSTLSVSPVAALTYTDQSPTGRAAFRPSFAKAASPEGFGGRHLAQRPPCGGLCAKWRDGRDSNPFRLAQIQANSENPEGFGGRLVAPARRRPWTAPVIVFCVSFFCVRVAANVNGFFGAR